MSAETFVTRLDAVRPNRFHWTLLLVSGLVSMFVAMDVVLIVHLIGPISRELAPGAVLIPLVAGAGLVGMSFGAAVFGRLADRHGRRAILQSTLLVASVGSLLTALAPTFEVCLFALAVSAGGLGAVLPVAATLVAELSPRLERGRMLVLLGSFSAYGMLLAGLLAVVVTPQIGWRGAAIVGALPALYVLYLRRALPESPRHLAARGRGAEADAAVRRVEREGGGALITVARVQTPPASLTARKLGDLFAPAFRRRTVMLWVVWSGVVVTWYCLVLYIGPEHFVVSTLAQVPGYLSAAWLVERWGRKPTLLAYLIGTAGAAYLFASNAAGTDAILWAAVLSFFHLGAWSALYAISPELYPTAIRASGAGIAVAVGGVSGTFGALVVPLATGQRGVITLLIALYALTALVVVALAEETKGRSLEELSET